MYQPKPLVIVADDDPDILRLMEFHLGKWGYRVGCAAAKVELLERLAAEPPALLLLDQVFGEHDGVELLGDLIRRHPDMTVAMLTAHGSIDTAVSAIKRGAYEYLTKPPDFNRLKVILDHAGERQRMKQKIEDLQQLVDHHDTSRPLWGESLAIKRIQEMIETVAPTDASVLILGETGTGKEVVARDLHGRSSCRNGPFITVNMAAMPRELMESTLFGHEKGAFTGADRSQIGCCEAAHQGTLFLDEISELELGLQAKLLRFLQERTIQPVGSTRSRTVEVRVLAASNRKLEEEVRAGRFREDLYYRLNVIPIHLPPLRERREDIGLFATLFLHRAAERNKRDVAGFTADALKVLTAYDWPGNVRQLENLVERVVILARDREIGVTDIPSDVRSGHRATEPVRSSGTPGPVGNDLRPIDRIQRDAIVDALTQSRGKVGQAAGILGLEQATVYRKLKRYGIVPKNFAGNR